MGCVLSLSRSEYSVVWLPTEPSVDATMPPADDLKNDPVPGNEALAGLRDLHGLSRFLVAFCVGVTATLAWQSCSDAARQLAETSPLQFRQTTPQAIVPASFAVSSLDEQHLAALPQNVDQPTTSERWISPIGALAPAQEQITHDFDSLQQNEQYTISKTSVPLPRPAPAETRKHASRPATTTAGAWPNARHALTSSTTVWPSSASPVLLTRFDSRHKRIRSSATGLRNSAPEPFSQSLISVSQSLILALSKMIQL
jgi:hypothetical protein